MYSERRTSVGGRSQAVAMGFISDFAQELKVIVFEGPVLMLKLLRYFIVGVYNFVVPAAFRMKEVHGETVLITGGGE